MRIEVQTGPVVLVLDRERDPKPGENFRVAVFVADKAMGAATVSWEQWVQYCQASLVMRAAPTPTSVETANDLPLVGANKFRVRLYGDMPVSDEIDVDVPEGWFEGKNDHEVEDQVIAYVTQLLEQRSMTVRWRPVVDDGDEPEAFVNGVEIEKIEIAVDARPATPVVCTTCNDTHRMSLEYRDVMCTKCPTPCQKCRAGGNGPYCAKAPCACSCHATDRRST